MLKQAFRFKEHSSPVYALCQGQSAHQVISGANDGFAVQWNFESHKQDPLVVKTDKAIWSNFLLPENGPLVLAVSNGDMHIIDVSTRKELHLLRLHSSGVSEMQFNSATSELYCAGGDGVLSVWNTQTWKLIRSIPLSTARLRTLAFLPEKKWLAIGGQEGRIHILETSFFNEVFTINAHGDGVSALSWHPSKSVLLSGGKDAFIKAWNHNSEFEFVAAIPAHNFAIYGIVFSPDHQWMATCSRDKSIKIWDSQTLDPLQRLEAKDGGHSHSVNRLIWNETGLYSCSDDRSVVMWTHQ